MSEPPRRRRSLSADERTLWESVAKTAKPLRKAKRKPSVEVLPDAAGLTPSKSQAPRSPAPRVKPVAAVVPQQPSKPSPKPPPPVVQPLGRRERSRIAKGRTDIDGRLDLHGMTQHEAHHRLLGFLHRMQGSGATFVLVITGKGKAGASSERGVLRRAVPQWLALPEFRVCITGFEEAHIAHGGEGALYVRLRRVRN